MKFYTFLTTDYEGNFDAIAICPIKNLNKLYNFKDTIFEADSETLYIKNYSFSDLDINQIQWGFSDDCICCGDDIIDSFIEINEESIHFNELFQQVRNVVKDYGQYDGLYFYDTVQKVKEEYKKENKRFFFQCVPAEFISEAILEYIEEKFKIKKGEIDIINFDTALYCIKAIINCGNFY